jgi:hypothetical protein
VVERLFAEGPDAPLLAHADDKIVGSIIAGRDGQSVPSHRLADHQMTTSPSHAPHSVTVCPASTTVST